MDENVINENNGVESTSFDAETKTYSEKDFQAEVDRRVTQAVQSVQKKYEKKLTQQNELIGLDENARKYKELQQRLEEAENKNKEYVLANEKNNIMRILSNRNLPAELSDYISLSEDNEENIRKIDEFENIVKKIVSTEVEKRINGSVPVTSKATNDVMTAKEFNKLSLAKQNELYEKNPELVKRILSQN